MKFWPVPNSFSKNLPEKGSGSFWEDRGDRWHCGVDIYAPEGSKVIAIEDCKVLKIGLFTNPERADYWNFTYFALVKQKDEKFCKYAELGEVLIKEGDFVKAGSQIGTVGLVLNPWKIDEESPIYIQKLKENPSMLHFETYSGSPEESEEYLGGNWFGVKKPKKLLNPVIYLKNQ